jgi:hypothetical protein
MSGSKGLTSSAHTARWRTAHHQQANPTSVAAQVARRGRKWRFDMELFEAPVGAGGEIVTPDDTPGAKKVTRGTAPAWRRHHLARL